MPCGPRDAAACQLHALVMQGVRLAHQVTLPSTATVKPRAQAGTWVMPAYGPVSLDHVMRLT